MKARPNFKTPWRGAAEFREHVPGIEMFRAIEM
jgi:hypothetical protein